MILFKAKNKGNLVIMKAIAVIMRTRKKGKTKEMGGACGLRMPALSAHRIM